MSAEATRHVYTLRTPENVTFEYELAGVSARGVAFLIDALLLGVFVGSVVAILSVFDLVTAGLAKTLVPLAFFASQWGYGVLFEWLWNGQTLGKSAVRLRVLGLDGFSVSLTQAATRNLVKIVDQMPALYGLGALLISMHPRAQRLGDLAAGTIVVQERRAVASEHLVREGDRHNTFLEDPLVLHAVARVTPPERDAMLALSFRRETLPLGVRQTLFAKLATHLSGRLGIEKPSFFSDEKYVLHLSAALFSASREKLAQRSERALMTRNSR